MQWKWTGHMMRSTTRKWTKSNRVVPAERKKTYVEEGRIKIGRRFADGSEKDYNGQANVKGDRGGLCHKTSWPG